MGRGDLLPPMFLKIFSSACAVIVIACFAALFVYPIYGAWHVCSRGGFSCLQKRELSGLRKIARNSSK